MSLARLIFLAVTSSPLALAALASAQSLPPDAQAVIAEYDAQVVAIQKKAEEEVLAVRKRAEQEILAAREEARKALKVVQDTYTKAGKLDEAVAIRDRIALLPAGIEVLPDPGTLTGYLGHVGKSFYFEVVGALYGSLYGDGIYTTDSKLAVAAVHAGILKAGQKGVVRVTILPGQDSYKSSGKNGITSSPYTAWQGSYKVESASTLPAGQAAESKKP